MVQFALIDTEVCILDDPTSTLTTESLLEGLVFEISNILTASVGYGELAKKNLDSSHPAFSDVTNALQAAERARAVVQRVGDEWRRRRLKSDGSKGTFGLTSRFTLQNPQ